MPAGVVSSLPSAGETNIQGKPEGEIGYNSHWRIFKHAKEIAHNTELLSDPTLSDNNEQLLLLAGDVMESWGEQWATVEQGTRWASFLNKKHLKEEVEESLVALAPLILWLEKTADVADESNKDVVDVCCGKGICSILLSYLCGRAKASNYRTKAFGRITKIVMLDRETSKTVDWGHIEEANKTAASEKRPMIEIWEGCNLHETDAIYDRFEAIPNTLALIGIHLCRHLSPCCVGLTNALGPDKAKFLCLAPCCLPRQVRRNKRTNEEARTIKIPLYEEPEARKRRIEAMKLREHAIGRGHRGADCYLCKSLDHFVRACPQLPSDVNERLKILKDAAKDSPCWKCGKLGHSKKVRIRALFAGPQYFECCTCCARFLLLISPYSFVLLWVQNNSL
jgi:hypothetical protein